MAPLLLAAQVSVVPVPLLLCAAVYALQHETLRSWAHLHGDRLNDRTRERGRNGKLPVCCKAFQRVASTARSGSASAHVRASNIFVCMMGVVLAVGCGVFFFWCVLSHWVSYMHVGSRVKRAAVRIFKMQDIMAASASRPPLVQLKVTTGSSFKPFSFFLTNVNHSWFKARDWQIFLLLIRSL